MCACCCQTGHTETADTSHEHFCRLETALQSWCNDECEDQLQHVISTHLRSRYASSDVKVIPAPISTTFACWRLPDWLLKRAG